MIAGNGERSMPALKCGIGVSGFEQVDATSPRQPSVSSAATDAVAPARNDAKLLQQVYQLADLSPYPVKERLRIRVAGLLLAWLIKLIGRTVRWTVVDWHHHEEIERAGKQVIYTFWHQSIFLATWFWRQRRIVVMTSRSADGEIIARAIQRCGYGAARGSSSKGASAALKQMAACLKARLPAAFTIDGPRGPRFQAKPGAVFLARMTGQAILPFHITPRRCWQLKSWDLTQIPYPFTRAVVLLGKPIYVEPRSREEELSARQAELQASLEALRARGQQWWQHEALLN